MSSSGTGKKLKLAFLMLPILVVFVSGCTLFGPTTSTSGTGIAVNTFEPDLSPKYSDQDVNLHLEVQNTGDYNTPAVAQLINIDTQTWGAFDEYQDLGTILAPDKEQGTEGGIATADWQLRTPMLNKGQEMTYTPMARIYYYYETRAIKPILFVTEQELTDIVRKGESLQSDPTVTTAGPLSIEVKTGNFVRTSDWKSSKFQVQINIENKGNGMVFGKEYPIAIYVEWPVGVINPIGDCPNKYNWGSNFVFYENLPYGLSQPTFGDFIKLWNGKSTKITCEFEVVSPPSNRIKKDLNIKLGYMYYVDKATDLKVIGKEETF
jgi:hypothetical protein